MSVQSYQPQVNLTAYETPARQRRVVRGFVTLAVLAGFALLGFRYRDSLRSVLPGASNPVPASLSDATAEHRARVSPAKSRRAGSARGANAIIPSESEAEGPASESKIRPPLVVEVIYGSGQRQIIHARDESIYLDLRNKTLTRPGVEANGGYGAGVVNASEQTPLPSAVAAPALSVSADSLVAKQQTLEGSVVLMARIDKNGNIETVQVISGPQNLYGAALEAVRQWRFKPYYKSGQTVETHAQITVKFAIATQ